MAIINYVEPVNIGQIFVGIGGLLITGVMSYILYKFYIKIIRYLDVHINHEIKYCLITEHFLNNYANKKGIDLDNEMVKRDLLYHKKPKSFRKKMEDKIFQDMFGNDKKGGK